MKLPDTASLVALMHLKRTGSLRETAEVMGRTHSAISRKIKGLEAQLGFQVTHPKGRGVVLTPRAEAYASDVLPLLTHLEQAGRAGSTMDASLTLSVAQGFAASWLIHHLGAFQALHPGIALKLTSPQNYGDLSQQADLHITFARPDEVPASATTLLSVTFFPVLAPRLLGQIDPQDPGTLLSLPLLHLNSSADWRQWVHQALGHPHPIATGLTFSDMHIMQAAAMSGQGVALGDTLTAQTALTQGTLTAPWPIHIETARKYYLVQGDSGRKPAAQAFETWLISALKSDQALPKRAIGDVGSR